MEAVEAFTVEPREDVLLVVIRVAASATGGQSGAPVEGEVGQIWTVEDGVFKRFEQCATWEEARRAAANVPETPL